MTKLSKTSARIAEIAEITKKDLQLRAKKEKMQALKALDPAAYLKEHYDIGLRNFLSKYDAPTLKVYVSGHMGTEKIGGEDAGTNKLGKDELINAIIRFARTKNKKASQPRWADETKDESVSAPPKDAKLIPLKPRVNSKEPPVKAVLAKKSGTLKSSWGSELKYRAGKDYILDYKGDGSDMGVVRGDIFKTTYKQVPNKMGYYRKNPDARLHYFVAKKAMTIKTLEGKADVKPGDKVMVGTVGEMWPLQDEKLKAKYSVVKTKKVKEAEAASTKGEMQEIDRLALQFKKPNADRQEIFDKIGSMPTTDLRKFVQKALDLPVSKKAEREELLTKLTHHLSPETETAASMKDMLGVAGHGLTKMYHLINRHPKKSNSMTDELVLDQTMQAAPEDSEAKRVISVKRMKKRWPSLHRQKKLFYFGNLVMVKEDMTQPDGTNATQFFVGNDYIAFTPAQKRLIATLIRDVDSRRGIRTTYSAYKGDYTPPPGEDKISVLVGTAFPTPAVNNQAKFYKMIPTINRQLREAGSNVELEIAQSVGVGICRIVIVKGRRVEPGYIAAPPKEPAVKKSPAKKPTAKKKAPAKTAAKKPAKKAAAKKKPKARKKATASAKLAAYAAVAPNRVIPDEEIYATEIINVNGATFEVAKGYNSGGTRINKGNERSGKQLRHADEVFQKKDDKARKEKFKQKRAEMLKRADEEGRLLKRGNLTFVMANKPSSYTSRSELADKTEITVKGERLELSKAGRLLLYIGARNMGRPIALSHMADLVNGDGEGGENNAITFLKVVNSSLVRAGANCRFTWGKLKSGTGMCKFVMTKSRLEHLMSEASVETAGDPVKTMKRTNDDTQVVKDAMPMIRKKLAEQRERKADKTKSRQRKHSLASIRSFLNRKGFTKNAIQSKKATRTLSEEVRHAKGRILVYEDKRGVLPRTKHLKKLLNGTPMIFFIPTWEPKLTMKYGSSKFEGAGTNHKEALNDIVNAFKKKIPTASDKKRVLKRLDALANHIDPVKDAEDRMMEKQIRQAIKEAKEERDRAEQRELDQEGHNKALELMDGGHDGGDMDGGDFDGGDFASEALAAVIKGAEK